MEGFGKPIYTSPLGVEFRVRESTSSVFTHHPRTEEWIYLCSTKSWPVVAERFGLRIVKKGEEAKVKPNEKEDGET